MGGCSCVMILYIYHYSNRFGLLKQCECNVDTVSQINPVWVHFKVQLCKSVQTFWYCSVCSLTFAPDEFFCYKIYTTFFQEPQTFSESAFFFLSFPLLLWKDGRYVVNNNTIHFLSYQILNITTLIRSIPDLKMVESVKLESLVVLWCSELYCQNEWKIFKSFLRL